MRLELGFRLCAFGSDGIRHGRGENITFRVCQRFYADELSAGILKDINLPANTDPHQRTQLANDRCSPATFPYERERVVTAHVGHGPWGWNFQKRFFFPSYKSYAGFLFRSSAQFAIESEDSSI